MDSLVSVSLFQYGWLFRFKKLSISASNIIYNFTPFRFKTHGSDVVVFQLKEIMSGSRCGSDFDKPIMQVLRKKRIGAERNIRYRLVVSDGKHFTSHVVLTKKLKRFVDDGNLEDNSIIRVEEYSKVFMPTGDTIVIMGMIILHPGEEVKTVIGDPENLNDSEILTTSTVCSISSYKSTKSDSSTTSNYFQSELEAATTVCSNSSNKSTKSVCSSTSNCFQSEIQAKVHSISSNKSAKSVSSSTGNGFKLTNSEKSNYTNRIIYLIRELCPYQKKGIIKACVKSKSFVRTWSDSRGMVKAFDIDLIDDSGEIRATCFDDAVDMFYELIQVRKVYFISKYVLHKDYQNVGTYRSEYEMTITSETIVKECSTASNIDPQDTYNFVPISNINNMLTNATVDIIGICHDAGDISESTSKATGRDVVLREITLVDTTLATITLTLWGKCAENFNSVGQPVVLIKSGRISGFRGRKSVSLPRQGSIELNPKIEEAYQLRQWYDNNVDS